ncbi:hypothetical protein Pfo_024637 [Paulownia fortunei]|nr:hypothetical protein Pfo_024637 [Paulownia fortunei]
MSGGALINGCRTSLISPFFIIKSISSSILCRGTHNSSNAYAPQPQTQTQTQRNPSSPSLFESKILRILRNEIQYQCDYAPPHQPVTEFDRFMVEDRPGEQWITLRGKSAEGENIKIEATMFDGAIIAQKSGDEGTEENLRLHISMLVDIWKGEGTDVMEFVCSAWSDSLEIQKVFLFRPDESSVRPYMGPDFKNLNTKLQIGFYKFLNTRGVNEGLSKFLHKYMMNKDRIELIQWLGKVHFFFKK